jgi:hypothetical protein
MLRAKSNANAAACPLPKEWSVVAGFADGTEIELKSVARDSAPFRA